MIHSLNWRKSTERTKLAREILEHPNMKAMLAVLELDHPAKNIPAVHDGFGATEHIGIIRGYEWCLLMLKQLGEASPPPAEPLVATWGTEETK